MNKISNFIYRMLLLPNLAHEFLHYLPARYWKLNPQIAEDWSYILSDRTTNARRLVIVLMPVIVGLLIFPAVWSMVIHQAMFHIAAAIFWVGWMIGCGKDIYKAGYFILFHKWHNRKDEQ
jgi:hypothetical protein